MLLFQLALSSIVGSLLYLWVVTLMCKTAQGELPVRLTFLYRCILPSVSIGVMLILMCVLGLQKSDRGTLYVPDGYTEAEAALLASSASSVSPASSASSSVSPASSASSSVSPASSAVSLPNSDKEMDEIKSSVADNMRALSKVLADRYQEVSSETLADGSNAIYYKRYSKGSDTLFDTCKYLTKDKTYYLECSFKIPVDDLDARSALELELKSDCPIFQFNSALCLSRVFYGDKVQLAMNKDYAILECNTESNGYVEYVVTYSVVKSV